MKYCKSYVLCVLWLGINSLSSAQQYNFSSYSLEQGLPQSEANHVIQDTRGNIWVATNGGGVCRFDGRNFEIFSKKQGLADDRVFRIFEDNRKNLYFFTLGGLSYFDGKKYKTYTKKEGFPEANFFRVYEDAQKRLWVFAQNNRKAAEIIYLQNGRFVNFASQHPVFRQNTPLALYQNKAKKLLITTQSTLWQYDGNTLTKAALGELPQLKNKTVYPLLEDHQGRLWLRSEGSKPGDNKLYYYQHQQLTEFSVPVATQKIKELFEDSQHQIWITTIGLGTFRYSSKLISKEFVCFNTSNGTPQNTATCILEDFEGNIWLGSRGQGLVRYNGDKFTWMNRKAGLLGDVIRPVFQDSHKNYWFGISGVMKYDGEKTTGYMLDVGPYLFIIRDFKELPNHHMLVSSNKGIWLLKPNGDYEEVSKQYGIPKGSRVHTMLTYNDTLWLSVYGKGIAKYANNSTTWLDKSNGFPDENVFSIYKSPQNDLWFCADHTISKYDGKGFTHYTRKDGIPNSVIMQATSDRLGQLWFVSYGGGLAKLDKQGRFTVFTKEHGISDNNLCSVLADNEGNLWLGAQRGIDKVSLDEKGDISDIKFYGKDEGFLGQETNGLASMKDADGNLWFGTINGAVKYNPKADQPNKKPPVIQFTNVRLFFKNVDWNDKEHKECHAGLSRWFNVPKNLVLPYSVNHLSFDFSALSFQVPEKVRYQWKMDGADNDWSPVTREQKATYTNLPPGKYTFRVRAMNNDGVWSKKNAQFRFRVTPPFWQTWWFRLLGLLLIGGVVLGAFRWRIQSLKARKKALEIQVKNKTVEIVQQRDEIMGQNKELLKQREEIISQRDAIEHRNELLSQKNHHISQSIKSAKTIQEALLPFENRMNTAFGNDYFVMYRPKDVVSGDFYWLGECGNKNILGVIDCTGHGVPGAFMSLIGVTLLNEIINTNQVTDPATILQQLRQEVRYSLKQDQTGSRNGMDAALITVEAVDHRQTKVVFAGAKRPLWYIDPLVAEVNVIKGSSVSIGIMYQKKREIVNHELICEKGTTLYLSSDGLVDQNNVKRKKFGNKKLQGLLLEYQHLPLDKQKQVLDNALDEFITGTEQRDDILLLGVRI